MVDSMTEQDIVMCADHGLFYGRTRYGHVC